MREEKYQKQRSKPKCTPPEVLFLVLLPHKTHRIRMADELEGRMGNKGSRTREAKIL